MHGTKDCRSYADTLTILTIRVKMPAQYLPVSSQTGSLSDDGSAHNVGHFSQSVSPNSISNNWNNYEVGHGFIFGAPSLLLGTVVESRP